MPKRRIIEEMNKIRQRIQEIEYDLDQNYHTAEEVEALGKEHERLVNVAETRYYPQMNIIEKVAAGYPVHYLHLYDSVIIDTSCAEMYHQLQSINQPYRCEINGSIFDGTIYDAEVEFDNNDNLRFKKVKVTAEYLDNGRYNEFDFDTGKVKIVFNDLSEEQSRKLVYEMDIKDPEKTFKNLQEELNKARKEAEQNAKNIQNNIRNNGVPVK